MSYTQTKLPPPEGKNESGDFRETIYAMRQRAGVLVGGRTARCGRVPTGNRVQVRKAQGKAFYSGLETCASVWRCPVCHTKISEGRRFDVDFITKQHLGRGRVFLVTFTTPHFVFDDLKRLRKGIALAYRRVLAGAPWKRMKARFGVIGMIRSLEVTYGRNGWHPHLHVLMLVKNNQHSLGALSDWLFNRWSEKIIKLGMGLCNRVAWEFSEARNIKATRDYMAKWTTSAELVGSIHKRSKGGQTPWQLLFGAMNGDISAGAIFLEYARGMEGAKQLTWSRGLREHYGMRDELSDTYLAAKEPPVAEVIGSLDRDLWETLWRTGLAAQVLRLAQEKNWDDVLAWATNETGKDWI